MIRFNNEDVIGEIVSEDDRYLTLMFPFALDYKFNQEVGREIVLLSEWFNLKLSSDQFITIEKSNIIGYINPSDEFLNFYKKAVQSFINKSDKESNSNLAIENMMDVIMESQNSTIH